MCIRDSCRIRRRNYWRLVSVGKFWYRSDMVKMTMCANYRFHASAGILHYGIIGDGSHFDKVHGMHFINFHILMYLHPVKLKSHIKHNDIIIYSYSGHVAVSYTHLRAHETVLDLVCRLLLE